MWKNFIKKHKDTHISIDIVNKDYVSKEEIYNPYTREKAYTGIAYNDM